MSTDPADRMDVAKAKRLREVMQAAQDRYEALQTKGNAEDGDALTAAETAMSQAHAAYDSYLSSFAGRLG